MADVKATRSELLKIKKQVKLAQSGYKLMRKKRDGLILEFFEVLRQARDLRSRLAQEYLEASIQLKQTMALEGPTEIKSIAMALSNRPSVELEVKNIMGVSIPKIKHGQITKTLMDRGYGALSTTIRMEKLAQVYEKLLSDIIQAAEVETKLRKLLMEIEKTKRRVNALEFAVIPKLRQQAAFIAFRLDELERETIFLMKRIKA